MRTEAEEKTGAEAARAVAASAAVLVLLLGFAAPMAVALGSRWLMVHAEIVARDAAPLLLLLVFAVFTAIALRRLPGRRWLAVALLYAGATVGTLAEVSMASDTGRRAVVEVLVMWWLAAPAVAAGILLEQVWRRKRRKS
jgi:hypothetical protein